MKSTARLSSPAAPIRNATLLKLVQPGNLDTEFLKRIRHLRMNGCVAKVHLALDGLPESWSKSTGRMVVAPSIDHVERAFDCAAKYGRVADRPALEIVIPSLSDPSLAPKGHHVASMLFQQYAPYRLRARPPTTRRAARLANVRLPCSAVTPARSARVVVVGQAGADAPQDHREFGLACHRRPVASR